MTDYPYCRALDVNEALTLLDLWPSHLTPAQLVDTCAFLRDNGVRASQISKTLGCRNYQVSHWVRVGRHLHPEVKELLHRNRLSLGHCRVIAGLPLAEQVEIARQAIARRKSVRALEKASTEDRDMTVRDKQYYQKLANQISDVIGHPVVIHPALGDANAGTLAIHYANTEMFDAICDRLRVNLEDFV